LGGGSVEPVRVIDHTDQRLLPGAFGKEAEHCQPDEETIRPGTAVHPEHAVQGIPLRMG
jgi:hypothetical protein